MNNRITTGSRAFFSGIKGFNPKDNDIVILVEPAQVPFKWMRQSSNGSTDIFEIVRRPKEELIDHAVKAAQPMAIARFLTPAFAREIGLTPSYLPQLKPMRDRLDKKHEYLGIIYDAYIAQNDFVLSDEQRDAAYESYKAARPEKKTEAAPRP